MSRFTTQRYELPFKPAFTIQGLMGLNNEIQMGLEELDLLSKLQANLERIALAEPAVSSEQLMIASTLNTVLRKSNLSIALESVSLASQFNEQVSLEGVGEMLKNGFDWVIKKIKEFFAFLRSLVKKFFSQDEKKAKEYKEASSFDFEQNQRDLEAELERMRRSHQTHREKMAKAFDNMEAGRKTASQTREDLNKIRDDFADAFEKDAQAKKDLSKLLRLARFDVASAGKKNRDSYTLGGKRRTPYSTGKEFVEFTQMAGRDLPKALRELTQYKLSMTNSNGLDELKAKVKSIQSIRGMAKFFEETDEDGIIYFAVKRNESEALTVSNSEMIDILSNCSDALVDIKTVMLRFESAEKYVNMKMDLDSSRSVQNEALLKCSKVYLKLITSYTKTLVDVRSLITYIGDDALSVVDSLK